MTEPVEGSALSLSRICSIEDCWKPVKSRGWCCAHYMRWWRNGDPLASGSNKVPDCHRLGENDAGEPFCKHGPMYRNGEGNWKCGHRARIQQALYVSRNPGCSTIWNRNMRNRQDEAMFAELAAQHPEIAALVLTKPEGA